MKQIRLHIRPDGQVQAETLGVTGKSCTDYIKLLEELLDAEAVSSAYKPEYFEEEKFVLETETETHTNNQTQSQFRLGDG